MVPSDEQRCLTTHNQTQMLPDLTEVLHGIHSLTSVERIPCLQKYPTAQHPIPSLLLAPRCRLSLEALRR